MSSRLNGIMVYNYLVKKLIEPNILQALWINGICKNIDCLASVLSNQPEHFSLILESVYTGISVTALIKVFKAVDISIYRSNTTFTIQEIPLSCGTKTVPIAPNFQHSVSVIAVFANPFFNLRKK